MQSACIVFIGIDLDAAGLVGMVYWATLPHRTHIFPTSVAVLVPRLLFQASVGRRFR